jgi:hypothetical protein
LETAAGACFPAIPTSILHRLPAQPVLPTRPVSSSDGESFPVSWGAIHFTDVTREVVIAELARAVHLFGKAGKCLGNLISEDIFA